MTRRPLPPPSRADAVRKAIANARLAGQPLSVQTLELLRWWELGQIDDDELLRLSQEQIAAESRRQAVANAVAITAMEGGEPSPFARELLRQYQDGEITAAEMRLRMHDHIKRSTDDA